MLGTVKEPGWQSRDKALASIAHTVVPEVVPIVVGQGARDWHSVHKNGYRGGLVRVFQIDGPSVEVASLQPFDPAIEDVATIIGSGRGAGEISRIAVLGRGHEAASNRQYFGVVSQGWWKIGELA